MPIPKKRDCARNSRLTSNVKRHRRNVRNDLEDNEVKSSDGFVYNLSVVDRYIKKCAVGQPTKRCVFCGALRWHNEHDGLCCHDGKVKLKKLKSPPAILLQL